MRRLYTLLIYATMILAVATVWAMGYESQAQSELVRAQQAAAAPQFNEELARIERADAAEAAAAAHPAAASPSTRPASPVRHDPTAASAEASGSEP
jgi:hypothetical protein